MGENHYTRYIGQKSNLRKLHSSLAPNHNLSIKYHPNETGLIFGK